MKFTHITALASLSLLIPTASGAVIWSVGIDDGTQFGNGTDPTTLGGVAGTAAAIQEQNTNTLPGNPANTGGAGVGRDIDDDFYFEGDYSTVVDGGAYLPVGIVGTREGNYERAFTGGDTDLRWHFNTPAGTIPSDIATFTIEMYSLDDAGTGTGDFALEMLIDGVSQGTQSHTSATNNVPISWAFTGADLGGATEAGAGFDHYVEVRSTATGGARWASLDYAQLDIVPEPSTGLLGLLGALTLLRRRR